ncbi:hypothetical protein HH214_20925 [Mucilaginibacter robiniae]|uniref:DUF4177 domain-containing protein n=1 Tax=Mucilaginibacter robiniae TaxID=2728022 RepID=A0A7L5E4C1_9SPHI|nr:hypothetical protein [Mucilaginibacter robiniae]QJD98162.1 hypothetical protein HH214_20925 [Mucilaginibacter robiniae]
MNEDSKADFPTVQYCMLKVSGKILSSKVGFELDLGQEQLTVNAYDDAIMQKTLKVVEFYNMIDALNYMSSLGWEIVHVYHKEYGGTTNSHPHYLMKRLLHLKG